METVCRNCGNTIIGGLLEICSHECLDIARKNELNRLEERNPYFIQYTYKIVK